MPFVSIFKERTGIEKEIDHFLDLASKSGLIYIQGINAYLANNIELFTEHLHHNVETEKKADTLRVSIEDLLYRKTLIPESRSDVLKLIERMDALLGQFKGVMFRFEIERPGIAQRFHDELKALNNCAVQSVEAMTLSLRAYFKDISQVADHMHKVAFWETESDKSSTRLQKAIFSCQELDLAGKMQLRDIVKHIDRIADQAEDLADSLAIFTIKRSL
ncbi:MAG: DUF47 family protein [Deltaproteobacteria bacterium]|jgi:hypothetical protein|nr:DUF47 family protein [Deltaproteobacteria bacterium]MCW8893631.1 DUF47 family protein [Deltaproteobacteria bacterium]MCW9049052.1 DUF47 family protein [Deltaproteobacteria bacterium]